MQCSTLLLLLAIALFLVLVLHVEESSAIFPYTIRGFVSDVRLNPLRFIGDLFFKKAFILKKLKLKWKLKKKFVLKKLLKKLFLSWKQGLILSPKAILPQIFAQYWGYKEPYYWGGGGPSQIPPSLYPHQVQQQQQLQHYHQHRHFYVPHPPLQQGLSFRVGSRLGAIGALSGRKRRAIRFPDEHGSGITSGSGSSSSSLSPSSSFSPSLGSSPSYSHHHHNGGGSSSSSSSSFFDENSFDELQSIGLGQQELEMLRQLPDNLLYEYKQEMEELETSASEPREADIMEYLTATNEFDTDHCIAKGICEVMSRGNRTSNQFENLLLEYYNEEPETRKDPGGTPAYVYDYAAFLGKSRRDEGACASYFPKCPEPTHQLTNFMDEVFSSEMCDPPVRNEL